MQEISQGLILIPVVVLALWTLLILLLIPIRRFRAVFAGDATIRDFEAGESDTVPTNVVLANRNYMNLLELPLLFYLACILVFLLQASSFTGLVLAWLYVALRVLHSLVHVTYNNVMHRFGLFAASNCVLLVIWLMVGSRVLADL